MNTLKVNAETMAFARVRIAGELIKDTHVPESLSGRKMDALDAVYALKDALLAVAVKEEGE